MYGRLAVPLAGWGEAGAEQCGFATLVTLASRAAWRSREQADQAHAALFTPLSCLLLSPSFQFPSFVPPYFLGGGRSPPPCSPGPVFPRTRRGRRPGRLRCPRWAPEVGALHGAPSVIMACFVMARAWIMKTFLSVFRVYPLWVLHRLRRRHLVSSNL